MVARLADPARRTDHALRDASVSLRRPTGLRVVHFRRLSMQWTTPTACDLRFGFEITMYVSAR
jgi:coenzyme PQQ precursor peptide PqqA